MTQNTEHINEFIVSLCDYAEERGLITRDDRVFAANAICEDMHVSSFPDLPRRPRCGLSASSSRFATRLSPPG